MIRPLAAGVRYRPFLRAAWITRSFRAICAVRLEKHNANQIKIMLQGWAQQHPGHIESLSDRHAQYRAVASFRANLFDFRGPATPRSAKRRSAGFDRPVLPRAINGRPLMLFARER